MINFMKKYLTHTDKQEMILEKDGNSIRLFLGGELQFLSSENYLYDNTMVDIPMMSFMLKNRPIKALIL